MKHWYQIVHGECVSQSYALYALDGIKQHAGPGGITRRRRTV